ncbi:hypothetical protein HanRHA438_Chr09g0428191 [Helianthus annuus]|nr:hypothetical protein HanRHA438_Chr09g0428191 [Helianthus annuus]
MSRQLRSNTPLIPLFDGGTPLLGELFFKKKKKQSLVTPSLSLPSLFGEPPPDLPPTTSPIPSPASMAVSYRSVSLLPDLLYRRRPDPPNILEVG